MASTLSQTATGVPTAVAGITEGRWLLFARSYDALKVGVATEQPSADSLAAFIIQPSGTLELVIQSGDTLWLWNTKDGPNVFGALAYQKQS